MLQAHQRREIERLVGRPVEDHVVDLDADETGCPGCGERLDPATLPQSGPVRCPECGLRLA